MNRYTEVNNIHSFDATYSNVIFRNNNLIMPYINLGIVNRCHDNANKMLFIDFAYMVFLNVTFLTVFQNNIRRTVINYNHKDSIYFFGGHYLDYDIAIFNDLEICCDDSYLFFLNQSRESYEPYIPFETDRFIPNLDKKLVEEFFKNKFMPKDISELCV